MPLITLWYLSLKTALLGAITSARRESALVALEFKEPILVYFPDRVVLMPILKFVPELTFRVHITQEVVLLHSFWGVLKKLAHQMWAKL